MQTCLFQHKFITMFIVYVLVLYSILHYKSECELFVEVGHLTLHGHISCDVFDKFLTQNHDICLPFLTEENLKKTSSIVYSVSNLMVQYLNTFSLISG